MPDEPTWTITLPVPDWHVLHKGLYKLSMEEALQPAMRLQAAMAAAQKPVSEDPPKLRRVKDGC